MKYNRVLLSSLNVLDHIKELFEVGYGTSNHVPQFNIIFCFVGFILFVKVGFNGLAIMDSDSTTFFLLLNAEY